MADEELSHDPQNTELQTTETPVSQPVPGWPKARFHPVYGCRMFEDPNAYARAGGDDGDWRFTSAGAADQARTHTEAMLAYHKNQQRSVEVLERDGNIVSNSVQADQSARAGNPEPGVVAEA